MSIGERIKEARIIFVKLLDIDIYVCYYIGVKRENSKRAQRRRNKPCGVKEA